jgi:hypothetical protein
MTTLPAPPVLDARSYQELVDETLARIPIHNPEWTNFNRSDPGVTLVELFAFLTESLLYRANQVPERNRRAFLSLLGIPLQPAASARGLVELSRTGGAPETLTLHADLEVRAGEIPFRTTMGLDLLPVEGHAYYKRPLDAPGEELLDHYRALYASYAPPGPDPVDVSLYETVPLTDEGVDLTATADSSLWIALVLRRGETGEAAKEAVRGALAGRVLSLGIVPVVDDPDADLPPGGRVVADPRPRLSYQLPSVGAAGGLGAGADRVPRYRPLDATATADALEEPAIVQMTLPERSGLALWADVDPLEDGAGDLPPALEDEKVAERVVTWLRVQAIGGARARLQWAGINAVPVVQQTRVVAEALPAGTGQPDQTTRLARIPVLPDSVRLTVDGEPWTLVDDLFAAGPEVPLPDPRVAPGVRLPPAGEPRAFALDPATGTIRFGDGLHGARPPAGAVMRADYAQSGGRAGNVGARALKSGPALPAGVKVNNPVRTWGGAEAESVAGAERQIPRFLRHRDRLVSADDFDAIVRRTPGVDVGRVDVIPAFSPELAPSAPGDAAGAVTLMVIPAAGEEDPAPRPDQPFLDAICAYVDPRRLVTTEVFLRGPDYKPIWVSVGLEPVAGVSFAEVRDAVKAALRRFLAPLPSTGETGRFAHAGAGWPRSKAVVPLELLAVASRVPGVDLVRPVLVGAGSAGGGDEPVPMSTLELPMVAGIEVVAGEPLPLDELRGRVPAAAAARPLPVPVIPETC